MTRNHTFTMPDAPVFGWEDPFYDSAGMTARESEHPLSSEQLTSARAGHAAGSRSRDGSGTHSGDRAPTLCIPPTKAPTPFGAPATSTEEQN